MSDWREGFNEAIRVWLDRKLPAIYPGITVHPVQILEVTEEVEGGPISDVTPGDDPHVELYIKWVDDVGEIRYTSQPTTLTKLMRELDS